MKTHKCMTIDIGGINIVCIHHTDDKVNPFWMYAEWYDGKPRRKLITKYADRKSVLAHVLDYMNKACFC